MTNFDKQLAAIRSEIHSRELSIRKIQDPILRTESYDAFKPEKYELLRQMKQIIDQRKVVTLTGDQPVFNYGKVLSIRQMKGSDTIERLPLRIGEKYDPQGHFMGYEISAFANAMFGKWTWADYVTDDPEALKTVLFEGYGEFKCIFAGWSDRDGRAILVHEDCPFNTLEEAGIMTNMTNETQSVKTRKYLGRCFAAGDMNYVPRWGKLVDDSLMEVSGEAVIELDNGEQLVLKYVNLDNLTEEEKADVDGHIMLSTRAHRILGLTSNPSVGDSWRVTVLERWMGKGHTQWVDGLGADIVIYGPKKLVGLKDGKFCFMSLGVLHAGTPNTDIQSVTNFKLYNLTKELARKYMRYVYIQAHDAKKLRTSILKTINSSEEEAELLDANAEDSWVLRKAIMRDISLFAFPGLYRRAVRYLTKRVLQCERFRVPMNIDPAISVAISRYAASQPNVILENGDIDMSRSLIAEGEICIPDLPDGIDVIIYRQPNENANAWYKLRNVHVPEYMGIAGKSVCFLGREVQKVLYRLGGGDMDDALIIIHNPEWVEHFNTLSYPETDKLVPVETPAYIDQDEFGDLGLSSAIDYSRYTAASAEYQINLATTAGLNIGSAVNANMDDDIKSDPVNKAAMLADLKARGHHDVYKWLDNADGEGRQPFTTAFLATNLELVIDAAVKDPALMASLRQKADEMNPNREGMSNTGVQGFISAYHAIQQVYPRCMANRIPKSKKDAGDYVLATSEQCKAQEAIINLREQLEQLFVKNEWLLARQADQGIVNSLLPANRDERQRLTWLVSGIPTDRENKPGLRFRWAELWANNLATSDAERADMFGFICSQLDDLYLSRVPNDVAGMSVELYAQLYKNANYTPVKTSDGRVQSFPDALLWTNKLANAFINQLVGSGYAGAYIQVRFQLDKHLAWGAHQLRCEAGLVYNSNDVAVGEVHPNLKPGMWLVEDGLIKVRDGNPGLQPKREVLDMIQPLSNKK